MAAGILLEPSNREHAGVSVGSPGGAARSLAMRTRPDCRRRRSVAPVAPVGAPAAKAIISACVGAMAGMSACRASESFLRGQAMEFVLRAIAARCIQRACIVVMLALLAEGGGLLASLPRTGGTYVSATRKLPFPREWATRERDCGSHKRWFAWSTLKNDA